jgi:hypothetical protein
MRIKFKNHTIKIGKWFNPGKYYNGYSLGFVQIGKRIDIPYGVIVTLAAALLLFSLHLDMNVKAHVE